MLNAYPEKTEKKENPYNSLNLAEKQMKPYKLKSVGSMICHLVRLKLWQ